MNELVICQNAMKEICQKWVDDNIKGSHKVSEVTQTSNTFTIKITEKSNEIEDDKANPTEKK